MRIFNKPIKDVTDNEMIMLVGDFAKHGSREAFIQYASDIIRDEVDEIGYEDDRLNDDDDLWKYEV